MTTFNQSDHGESDMKLLLPLCLVAALAGSVFGQVFEYNKADLAIYDPSTLRRVPLGETTGSIDFDNFTVSFEDQVIDFNGGTGGCIPDYCVWEIGDKDEGTYQRARIYGSQLDTIDRSLLFLAFGQQVSIGIPPVLSEFEPAHEVWASFEEGRHSPLDAPLVNESLVAFGTLRSVPEPSSSMLLLIGLAAIAIYSTRLR